MIDKELKDEILNSISKSGHINTVPLKVNVNLSDIINFSSGSPRIQSTAVRRAKLIISRPTELSELSPQLIRCCLCNRTISYPAWYYNIKYVVNSFHYFICLDKDSPNKLTAKCYRRT